MSTLSLFLLGRFRAIYDDDPLTHFGSNKVQALLIYLTASAAQNSDSESLLHEREALMELLWPGLLPQSAQNNLRQTIYKLRQLIPAVNTKEDLPQEFILSERQAVQLNPDAVYELDVAAFTHYIKQTQFHAHVAIQSCPDCQSYLQKAAALYQGEFLSDFYLPDSNHFEDWAWNLRALLHRQALDALDTLTLVMLRRGKYNQARSYAERQLAIDPLRESACRQLMEILAISGQPSEALTQYEHLRQLLLDEMGMAPMKQTTAIYDQIRAGELGTMVASEPAVRGYDIQEEIGVGAFGIVHRARQPYVNRDVAVKVIAPDLANQPDFIRRFEVEAQLVARLEHPYIVPLYDYWREPDAAYLVMRYLRGGNLEQLLAKGPLSTEKAGRVLEQLCAALQVAHQQSIVHRDIKPANILLDEAGNAYLSDFGFAKELGSRGQSTEIGAIIGTPDYISPEQFTDEPVSPASDIYSLGILLFQMLTGSLPFPDVSLSELIYKHLHEQLPSARRLRPELPPAVDEIIWKATAKKPQARFPTTLALAAAFQEALPQRAIPGDVVIIPIAPGYEVVNPYKGLRPFQEADNDNFFGRDALVKNLLSHLAPTSPVALPLSAEFSKGADRFLAVVGPSGSGKSSVVKAGLLPALRRGDIPGAEDWFVVEMVPGPHPLEELEAALLQVAVNPPPSLLEPLQKDERGLIRTLKRVLPPSVGNERPQLLLVIDQFEELFTLVEEKEARRHFIDSLIAALEESRSHLRLLITLRADFYDRPLQHPGLGELLRQRTEVVLPLTPAELEQTIIRPAAQMGVRFEQGLAATIAADVADQPGALPLLQYALTELFEKRQEGMMTAAAYEAIGGVDGALGRRSEALYQALPESEQAAARQLFLRLITLDKGIGATRRRVLRSELASLSEVGREQDLGDSPELDVVIDTYVRARLLTLDCDPASREPTVEVAHEAILREWERLSKWLEENRDDVRLQRRLAAAAAEWEQAARAAGFLLTGGRLDQFAGWVNATQLALTVRERAFLAASLAERQAREAEEEARRRQELETAQRLAETERRRAAEQVVAAQNLRRRALYLGMALVAAVILAIAAGVFSRQSVQNADLAATREYQALTNLALAMTREEEANEAANERATAQAVSEAEADARGTAEGEAVERQLEAEAEADARATAEAVAVQRQLEAVTAGRLALAQSSAALSAQIFQQNNDTELATLLAVEAYRMNMEEDGRLGWLVDSSLRPLLDGSTYFNHTLSGHNNAVNSVVFSPDGKWLASGSEDETVRVWEIGQGSSESLVLTGHEGIINAVAFSLDGQWLASGSQDSTVQVWKLADLGKPDAEPLVLIGHQEGVTSLAFSEEWLISGSIDGTVRIWNAADLGQEDVESRVLSGLGGGVTSVAVSPDGQWLASGHQNAAVQVWNLAGLGQATVESRILSGHAESVTSVAFSEQRLASSSWDGTVRVWNMTDFGPASATPIILEHNAGVLSVSFSPDGQHLVSGSENWVTRIWDLEQEVAAISSEQENNRAVEVLNGQVGGIRSVTYSLDGMKIATGSVDGTVRVWDLGQVDPVSLVLTGHTGIVREIRYSSTGQKLASGSEDGTVRVWDLGQESTTPQILVGHEDWVRTVAIRPDGLQLASGSADGTVRVWDLSEFGQEILEPLVLTGFEGTVWTLDYSPDGQWLAIGNGDGTVQVWDTADLGQNSAEPLILTGHQDVVRAVAFSPDGKWLASGSWDNTVHMWNTADFGQIGAEPLILDEYDDRVLSLAFSPDSHHLASGSTDGTVHIWDLADLGQPLILDKHDRRVLSVAFSPDGQRLASGSGDETVQLWNWSQKDIEPIILTGHTGWVWSVAYSPNGQWLASGGGDMTVRLWLLLDELIELGCRYVWRNLSWAEWQQFLPGEPYRRTCPNLPPHPSVPPDLLEGN